MSRQSQLVENIEYVVGEYYNGMLDDPEEYPALTKEECIEYVKDSIYDMKVSGSHCRYKDGICDDLKFLGDEYIDKQIMELAEDILA